jgi:hypothetical protein
VTKLRGPKLDKVFGGHDIAGFLFTKPLELEVFFYGFEFPTSILNGVC